MRTVAIVPVKSFGRSKTRTGLDAEHRVRLADELVTRTLGVLVAVEGLDATIVVTGEPRAAQLALGHGFQVVEDAHEHSHSAAARLGIRAALRDSAGRALLVPGDCPRLDGAELDRLLASAGPGVTVIGDHHGTGTNALLLEPPDAITPSFGPGSFARHTALARGAGVAVRVATVPSLTFDIDTAEDLAAAADDLDLAAIGG